MRARTVRQCLREVHLCRWASFFVPGRYADGEIDCLQAFGEQWVEKYNVCQAKRGEKRCKSQPVARVGHRNGLARKGCRKLDETDPMPGGQQAAGYPNMIGTDYPAVCERWVEESHVSRSKPAEKRCISQPVAREPFFHQAASHHFTTSVVK